MTVADMSLGWHQAATDTRGRHAATTASRLPVSVVALSAAVGVLIVAAAYTAGRLGHASSAWTDRTFWLGQAFILVPAAVRLTSRVRDVR